MKNKVVVKKKVVIKEIVLEINGKEIKLPLDEARELYEELQEVFGQNDSVRHYSAACRVEKLLFPPCPMPPVAPPYDPWRH